MGTPTSASAWLASISEPSMASGTTSVAPAARSFSRSLSSMVRTTTGTWAACSRTSWRIFSAEERDQARLRPVTLPVASPYAGEPLGDLVLEAIGVQVVSVRRASGAVRPAQDGLELQGGDTLVLSGTPEALALAEEKLLRS